MSFINYFFEIVVPQLLEYFKENANNVTYSLLFEALINNNIYWLRSKKMFSLITLQFGRVMRNMKRRHEHDYYFWVKSDKDKKTKIYVKQERVDWLKEVYFNKEEHWLTSEISFYKKKIFDLENELGIDHKRNKYESFSLRFLPYLFGKSVSTIHVAFLFVQFLQQLK